MKFKIIILFIAFYFANNVYAQFGSSGVIDARSLGMGKTHTSISEGVFTIGVNPANLIFSNEGAVDFSTIFPLPNIGVKTGTDFLNYNDFVYYFGGIGGSEKILTSEDQAKLNRLFENGGLFFTNASVSIFSISFNISNEVGSFAFAMQDYASGKINFPQAVKDLSYSDGKIYDFSDADIKAWWIRNYSFSYARQLEFLSRGFFDKFGFGFSVKLYNGFGYLSTDGIQTYLQTNANGTINGQASLLAYSAFSDNFGSIYDFDNANKKMKLTPFPSPAGKGVGVDFGFSAQVSDRWRFALAVTDIGQITWNKNAARFVSEGDITVTDISNKSQRDSVFNKIFGSGELIDKFVTKLPTALRFGSSVLISDDNEDNFFGKLLLAMDLNYGLNKMPGNSNFLRSSFGAEWRPWRFFPYMRTGVELGGKENLKWYYGLGFDFGFLELNIATNAMQNIFFPGTSEMISASISSRWKID